MKSVNPKNNALLRTYKTHTEAQAIASALKADNAFQDWRNTSFAERSEILMSIADTLLTRKTELARLMADEMGKPLAEGISEIEKCAWVCRYYAENAQHQLADQVIDTEFKKSKITYQPMGCILAVMPWNYPFWQVFRFAAPALMAGNTVLLKHAENVSGCALAIHEIFESSTLVKHAFTTLLTDKHITKALIEHPAIKAVTLTGSTQAGKSVAASAGSVLKKCVLELGGSDAYLVLKDANIDLAVNKCAQSRLLNAGQSCISAKRIIVHQDLITDFERKLVEKFKAQNMGDPLAQDTTIGPMARLDLRDALHQQVQRSIESGARCLLGGYIPDQEGAFYPPTVLSNVAPGMPAFDEELFGPVATIISADSTKHAIELANQSEYGLGGAIFSQNLELAEHIATHQIDSGACFINDFVKSDPRLPFGGIKQSGFGRELGEVGIREFVNIKTVCLVT